MGQYWQLVNIDKREQIMHYAFKLGDYLADRSAEMLVGLLQSPTWLPFKISPTKLKISKQKCLDCPLAALPQEVIDLIVTALSEVGTGEDIIALSLASSYFFRLLASPIQKLLETDYSAWKGDRLIFVGDYASGIPRDLGTKEERSEWEALGENPLYVLTEGRYICEGIPKRLPIWVKRDQIHCYSALDLYALERMESEEAVEDIDLCCRLMAMLKVDLPRKPGDLRVLRNLTTKEYVVDQVVAQSKFAYSLGEAILVSSVWTNDASGVGDLDLEGKWAGHRFDISSIEDVAGSDWKDVTDEAIRLLEVGTEWPLSDGRRA